MSEGKKEKEILKVTEVTYTIDCNIEKVKYSGVFKRPDWDTLDVFYSKLEQKEEFEADMTLARGCFVNGDKEMIDFENHLEIFLSYRTRLFELIRLNPCGKANDLPKELKDINHELAVKLIEIDKGKKDKNGQIIIDSCPVKYALFRKPTFKEIKIIMNLFSSGNAFLGQWELATKCFVGGDKEMISPKHPEHFASYKDMLLSVYKIGTSSLKKN